MRRLNLFRKLAGSLAAAGLLASSSLAFGGDHLIEFEPDRPQINPACLPAWGYHQTCWQRFPALPPCPTQGCSTGTCDTGSCGSQTFAQPPVAPYGLPQTVPSYPAPGGHSHDAYRSVPQAPFGLNPVPDQSLQLKPHLMPQTVSPTPVDVNAGPPASAPIEFLPTQPMPSGTPMQTVPQPTAPPAGLPGDGRYPAPALPPLPTPPTASAPTGPTAYHRALPAASRYPVRNVSSVNPVSAPQSLPSVGGQPYNPQGYAPRIIPRSVPAGSRYGQ